MYFLICTHFSKFHNFWLGMPFELHVFVNPDTKVSGWKFIALVNIFSKNGHTTDLKGNLYFGAGAGKLIEDIKENVAVELCIYDGG